MDISGKTAIVTGAASGIGLGIATALAEAGANVVMADIQKAAVEEAAHGLSGTNKRVMAVRIDVTQEQSVLDALAEAEQKFGKLHIACNNAGVPMHGTGLVDVPPGDWEFVMGVNIWGIIHGIRHFVPAILRYGEEGHVVNTAGLRRRLPEPPRHQPGAVFDEQIRRPFPVRVVGARTRRDQCRRVGAVPGSDQHQYRPRRPQSAGPHGRAANPRQ
jgi:NAD(P)-dependent dehydrogenase (short-subunit alcohol dehydrogenase family)